MKKLGAIKVSSRLNCSFCGAEVGTGEQYWQINGAVVCEACLPEFARRDYLSCRCVRGGERFDDAF